MLICIQEIKYGHQSDYLRAAKYSHEVDSASIAQFQGAIN